jgi:hypothetical protein
MLIERTRCLKKFPRFRVAGGKRGSGAEDRVSFADAAAASEEIID